MGKLKIRYTGGLEEGKFYLLNFVVDQIKKEEAENLPKLISDNIIKFLGEKIRYLERLDEEEVKELKELGIEYIGLDCNIGLYLNPENRCFGLKLPKHKEIFNIVHGKEIDLTKEAKEKNQEIDRKEIHQQAIREGLKELSEIILESST